MAKLVANIIARERTTFEALLLRACLASIVDHVSGIVFIDNGCSPKVKQEILGTEKLRSKVKLHEVSGNHSFCDLRQRALDATLELFPEAEYFFWTDADEVWFDSTLQELHKLLDKDRPDAVAHSMVHFVPDPFFFQHIEFKLNTFKITPHIGWRNNVHEVLQGVGNNIKKVDHVYHHYGYCKEQWRTALKFLRYAIMEHGNTGVYKDADWLTTKDPNKLLDSRRHQVHPYTGSFPSDFRNIIWVQHCNSGLSWPDFLESINFEDNQLWRDWQKKAEEMGGWINTRQWMEEILRREVAEKHG